MRARVLAIEYADPLTGEPAEVRALRLAPIPPMTDKELQDEIKRLLIEQGGALIQHGNVA